MEGEHAERSSHFGLQELNALLVFAITEAVESYLFEETVSRLIFGFVILRLVEVDCAS